MLDRGFDPQTRRLLNGTLVILAVTAAVLVAAAAVFGGPGSVAGAGVGVGLVLLLFAGSAALLAVVSRRSPGLALAVLVGGAFARLVVYAAVLVGLSGVTWIDRTILAVATGVAVTVTLVYELHALSRMPRLFWVDADVARPRTVPSATRS